MRLKTVPNEQTYHWIIDGFCYQAKEGGMVNRKVQHSLTDLDTILVSQRTPGGGY